MDDRFELMIVSDADHDHLCAEVFYDGKFVALVTKGSSSGKYIVETPGPGLDEDQVARTVDLEGFLEALSMARGQLEG